MLSSGCATAGSERWCKEYRQKIRAYDGVQTHELRVRREKMQVRYVTHCAEVDPEYASQVKTRIREDDDY